MERRERATSRIEMTIGIQQIDDPKDFQSPAHRTDEGDLDDNTPAQQLSCHIRDLQESAINNGRVPESRKVMNAQFMLGTLYIIS